MKIEKQYCDICTKEIIFHDEYVAFLADKNYADAIKISISRHGHILDMCAECKKTCIDMLESAIKSKSIKSKSRGKK